MAIIKNALTYGFGFNVTAAGPVDSRMRVNYLTDLTTVWGTSTDGVFTPNPDAPVYAGIQVIVNEQNKAYILKQQVAEGYTLDEKTQVIKNGLVYNKADDAPIAANPTDINNWVPVGTDFSGDIADLDGRIDDLETFKNTVDNRLNIADNSTLEFDSNGTLKVKIAEDSDTFINGIELDENGALKVATYNLVAKRDVDDAYASQYEFKVNGTTITTINIPKDQFLSNAEFIAELSVEDATLYGLESGKPYLKFTWQLDTNPTLEGDQKVTFVPVKDLVDVYTADEVYINMTDNNVITLDITAVTNKVSQDLGIANLSSTVSGHTAILNGTNNDGLIADVAENASNISKLAGLKINNKSISTTSTDGKTSIQDVTLTGADVAITGYTKGTASNLTQTDTINQALGKLEARVDAAAAGGVQTVNGMSGDVVIESGSTNGTISVHKSGSAGGDVAITGLKSAAFTESSDYATSAQGTKADNAVQNVTVTASNGYDARKEIVTVTKDDDNAINLAFNFATSTELKAGTYLEHSGPFVKAGDVSNLFLSLHDDKADKDTTYTKTEVDALFSWVEL